MQLKSPWENISAPATITTSDTTTFVVTCSASDTEAQWRVGGYTRAYAQRKGRRTDVEWWCWSEGSGKCGDWCGVLGSAKAHVLFEQLFVSVEDGKRTQICKNDNGLDLPGSRQSTAET